MSVFKKVSLIFLCIVLLVCVFVACDNSDDNGGETSAETTAETTAETSVETSTDTRAEAITATSVETSAETVEDKITFKTLTVNGTNLRGEVANAIVTFSFLDEVEISGNAMYTVSLDIYGRDFVPTKTVALTAGDNTFYIFATVNGQDTLYTVTIRRRPLYVVTFDTKGGTAVKTQTLEEGEYALAPETTLQGYTFVGWDFDFSQPITQSTVVTASWVASTDTAYKVEYYLETLSNGVYDLYETVTLTGRTGTWVWADVKSYEHFSNISSGGGEIRADGSLVLKVYYTRNNYSITSNHTGGGNISILGEYPYGTAITLETITPYLGYSFDGWYIDNECVASTKDYTINIDKDVEARFTVAEEMQNFKFSSTMTMCTILGVHDKTVEEIIIPDYVNNIENGAFDQCTSLLRVSIGRGVKTLSNSMFRCCTSLKSISIPDNVTSMDTGAFFGCTSLESITIPKSVTIVGAYLFNDCVSLNSITYMGTKTEWKAVYKGSFWNYNTGRYTIHCIDGEILK